MPGTEPDAKGICNRFLVSPCTRELTHEPTIPLRETQARRGTDGKGKCQESGLDAEPQYLRTKYILGVFFLINHVFRAVLGS